MPVSPKIMTGFENRGKPAVGLSRQTDAASTTKRKDASITKPAGRPPMDDESTVVKTPKSASIVPGAHTDTETTLPRKSTSSASAVRRKKPPPKRAAKEPEKQVLSEPTVPEVDGLPAHGNRLPSFGPLTFSTAPSPVPDDGANDDWRNLSGDPDFCGGWIMMCHVIGRVFVNRARRARDMDGKSWEHFHNDEVNLPLKQTDLDNQLRLAILEMISKRLCTEIWQTPWSEPKLPQEAKRPKRDSKIDAAANDAEDSDAALRVGGDERDRTLQPTSWAQDRFGEWQPLYENETAVPDGARASQGMSTGSSEGQKKRGSKKGPFRLLKDDKRVRREPAGMLGNLDASSGNLARSAVHAVVGGDPDWDTDEEE